MVGELLFVGNQWFWVVGDVAVSSCDVAHFSVSPVSVSADWASLPIDSEVVSEYVVSELESTVGDLRIVTVCAGVVLVSHSGNRLCCSATDVIHSFALPCLALKSDSVPGRCNGISLSSHCVGQLCGQCSEICGSYHGFMPVNLWLGLLL